MPYPKGRPQDPAANLKRRLSELRSEHAVVDYKARIWADSRREDLESRIARAEEALRKAN
ncbi:MAG: hypothetical protein H0T54_07475 [Geodermatophilaceae bacterium]|nr:hypothetical protein [Geodermatophilaceae bacterium]